MLDKILLALANKYRRRLLVALLGHNPQDDVPVPEKVHIGEKELETLENAMFHTHLPKLEEAGFIQWDRETHTVSKGPRFEEIRPLLELMNNHSDELPDNWI